MERSSKSSRALSDIIAFLITLIVILSFILPLTLYILNNATSVSPTVQQQEKVIGPVINVTYSPPLICLKYPSSLGGEVELLNVYNYTSGYYSQVKITPYSSQNGEIIYEISNHQESPKELVVEIYYNGQFYFAYLPQYGYALVG